MKKLLCVMDFYDNPRLGVIAKQGEEREFEDSIADRLLDEGGWLLVPSSSGDKGDDSGPEKASRAKAKTSGTKTGTARRKSTRKKVTMDEAMDPNKTTIKVGKEK